MKTNSGTLSDLDNQLIAAMEEVVTHSNGLPSNCRETVVEFADAKAIWEKLGMTQSAFSSAFEIPIKALQH